MLLKRRYLLKRKLKIYERPYVAKEAGTETLIPVKTPHAAAQTIQWSVNKSF